MSKAPGRCERDGITMIELFKMFPNNKSAEKWFEDNIWANGRRCGRCGYSDTSPARHPTMPYWCLGCKKYFSVKFGTVMEHSKISYQYWAIATYQFATNLKGVSSMKLHRDLGITQTAAWFMVQRLRESWKTLAGADKMEGPVEIDEVYLGGLEKNKHADKKGKAKKTAVVGIKDRKTNTIRASPVPETTSARLGHFVEKNAEVGAKTYTDDNAAYCGLANHESVNHSVGEYVRGMAHINGMESFWALLRRGYYGTFHHLSEKHLHRYINEFAGRHNIRSHDTIDRMVIQAQNMVGKRLSYKQLVGPNPIIGGLT